MDRDDVVSTLNDLIRTCRDGEEGFRLCAESVGDELVRERLEAHSRECALAAHELQALVGRYGGTAETGQSTTGALHQAWVNLRAALQGADEKSILAECERGEDTAVSRYRNALERDLPQDVRTVVERQYRGVLQNHDDVRRLRDRFIVPPAGQETPRARL